MRVRLPFVSCTCRCDLPHSRLNQPPIRATCWSAAGAAAIVAALASRGVRNLTAIGSAASCESELGAAVFTYYTAGLN